MELSIAVFGLGKLGGTLAGVLASSGHSVREFDVSPEAIQAVNLAQPLSFEPELKELLEQHRGLISAFADPNEALTGTSVAYVIVPTPSTAEGAFDNSFVLAALEQIAEHLRDFPREYTIVIASTVMPGSCEEEFIPLLERVAGLMIGQEIGLAYSPEFIALGSIVKDMRFPDLVLVGESDSKTGQLVSDLSRTVTHNKPEVRRMSLSSAEVAKIAINTFVTTKISFANMLSEVCDAIPGAHIDDVTSALGSDSRIGPRYLRGALGYGGPCFPRDNRALTHVAESRGVRATIARATDEVNERQVDRIVDLILMNSTPGDIVAIVGLAYKADTPVLEGSQAVAIGKKLTVSERMVMGFDELVIAREVEREVPGIELVKSPIDLARAQVIVLALPVKSIEGWSFLAQSNPLIIDMWGSLTPDESHRVLRPGVSSSR